MQAAALRIWQWFGQAGYYAAYPLLAWYLSRAERTRIAIWYKNEVLLVKPWLSGGNWELPGGGLHKEENPLNGVLREVEEELKLKLPTESVKSLGVMRYRSGLIRYPIHCFKIQLEGQRPDLKLQWAELTQADWFSAGQIRQLTLHQTVRELLEKSKT